MLVWRARRHGCDDTKLGAMVLTAHQPPIECLAVQNNGGIESRENKYAESY